MNYYRVLSVIFLIIIVSSLAGCMSGEDDGTNTDTQAPTTVAPTTSAPTTAAPTSTEPPTTAPSTTSGPPMVHNECSKGYINFDEGNGRYYPCDSPDDPIEIWQTDILMTEGPVLVDYERAYLFQSNYGDYEVKCYNVHTGEEYWTINTPFMSLNDVILKDGKLYIFQLDQPILHCYDAEDGTLLWSSQNIMALYPEKYDIDLINMSYSNGKILALMLPFEDVADWGGSIMCCFNGATGQLIWNFMSENDIRSYPAIGNGNAYYSVYYHDTFYGYSENTAQGFIGVNIGNGDIVLNSLREEYSYNSRDLVFSNGCIYALVERLDYRPYDDTNLDHYYSNMYLMCFSTSGDILWEEQLADQTWGNIIIGNDRIYLSRNDKITCFDQSTHEELWSRQWDRTIDISRNDGSLLTKDKLIIFFSSMGTTPQVVAINMDNGEDIWTLDLEGMQISTAAAFYENLMLVATDLGHLYCFG